MEIGEAVGRYEQAAALLPSRWQQAARRVPEHRKAQAEEFRLRAGRPMTLLTCEGELLVSDELPRQSVTQADLEQLCDAVTGYSRYAAAETMGKGYLIGRGGFRIGLCGTVAVRGDGGTALRDISSAVVRISRQVRGLWQEVPEWSAGGFDSTLIAAPPGGGKTTLLRDMIATLSNGTEDRCPLRVGVVDERGELAGMYRGVPQLDVGCHTDVLDGCPKALGIPMLLRSANPQVIAVDEITEAADSLAMTAAANCGVKLLATIHAEDGEELRRGLALVAPADLQCRVVRVGNTYRVNCKPGEKVSGHRPSVDVLFSSMAQTVKCRMVGIIMTGMGRDGADGLLAMRKAGAYTIGQDKESSVVYGMPMVANDIGAVCVQSSCEKISDVLLRHLKSL